jgi:hypothetical protein
MEINIEDYLTDYEIKDILKEEIKDCIKTHMKDENNIRRILSNLCYDLVYKMVDEIFNDDLENILTVRVKEIIDNLSEFTIFKEPSAWDREPNKAYKVLQKEIESHFGRIKEIVKESIDIETMKKLKENIDDKIQDAIYEIYKEI